MTRAVLESQYAEYTVRLCNIIIMHLCFIQGPDGADGIPGQNARNGTNGANGLPGEMVYIIMLVDIIGASVDAPM